MSTRDPRTDPQPGDVLRKGRKERRVECRGPDWGFPDVISGEESIVTSKGFVCYTLSSWRRWAKDAEVIR